MSLDLVLFTIADQPFTLGQLLLIPTVLVVGYLLVRWLAHLITRRLAARAAEADIIRWLTKPKCRIAPAD